MINIPIDAAFEIFLFEDGESADSYDGDRAAPVSQDGDGASAD